MWRELVSNFTDKCEFVNSATDRSLNSAEQTLRITLPASLRSLLLESNGISGEYGMPLVWPIERIVADNVAFRSNQNFVELYMPFDHLLFFADAGNGDQFAFAILGTKIRRQDVFAWNHEDDSRIGVAPSLNKYLEWLLSGRIKV